MVPTRPSIPMILVLALLVFCPDAAAAITVIGQVSGVDGTAVATDARGVERELRRGRALLEGDRVQTGEESAISFTLKDGTVFNLSENSAVSVDAFTFGGSDDEDTLSARIIKGAFRFVSGLVAKERRDAMTVKLGVTASIGIRGTNVGGELIGEEARVVLLEPEPGDESSVIEVYNQHGSVLIDEPGYGTVVADADSAPSRVQRMKLKTVDQLIKNMTRFRLRFN